MKRIFSLLVLLLLPIQLHAALSTSLISYWPGNEASGNLIDAVVASGNDLGDNATVTSSAGKVYSTARQYTRANSEYHSLADNASLSTGNIDFTLAAWVYMDTLPAGDATIVGRWLATGNQLEYQLFWQNSSNRFRFQVSSAGTASSQAIGATNFGSLSTNTWYFVVAWHDSVANTINISVNAGTANSAGHSAGVFNSTSSTTIGSTDGTTGFWNGRIGPVGFWKKVLTTQEITDLYNNSGGLTYEGILGTGIIMHPLTSGSDTTSSGMAGAPFTTASVSVSANSLIILAHLNAKDAGLSSTITVAGLGGTWVEIDHSSYHTAATPTRKVSLFRTMIGTTQTGTVTMTHDSAQDGAAWSLVEFTGVQTGGTNGSAAVVQEKGASGGSGSTQVTCTLDNSFSDSVNNVAFGVFGRSATGGITPEAGFIKIHDTTFVTPSNDIETQWRKGENLSNQATWSGGTDCGCQAIEIKALAAAGTNPFVLLEDDDE